MIRVETWRLSIIRCADFNYYHFCVLYAMEQRKAYSVIIPVKVHFDFNRKYVRNLYFLIRVFF